MAATAQQKRVHLFETFHLGGGNGHVDACRCVACQNKVPIKDRLSAKLSEGKNGCWEWTGKIALDGYGIIRIGGKEKRVHRVSFDEFVRPASPDEVICHHCDNRRCFNPAHLFAGSLGDNNRDMAAKSRARNRNTDKRVCDHGHAFTVENTIITRKGERQCRECHRLKLQHYRARKRSEP